MSTITGTIKSITLLQGPDNQSSIKRYTYALTFDATTTTAGDDILLSGIATAVATTNQKSGKTLTLRTATSGLPGMSLGGTAVCANTVTVATTTITCVVGGATAAAAVAGCERVGIIAVLDES